MDECYNSCGECDEPLLCDHITYTCVQGGAMCNNTCGSAGDEECDDGGRGCLTSLCEFGSDCQDCGERVEGDRLPDGTDCPGE